MRRSNTNNKHTPIVKLSSHVYQELKKDIIIGAIKPGESLLELDLTKRFNTSQAPIREACIYLHKEGFLNALPFKGFTVTEITIQEIRDIFAARVVVECETVEKAALNGPNSQDLIAKMESNMKIQQSDINLSDPFKYLQAEIGFHMAIAVASGNSLLAKFAGDILSLFQRFYWKILPMGSSESREETVAEHLAILNAIKNQNPEVARSVMRHHIFDSRGRSIALYFR